MQQWNISKMIKTILAIMYSLFMKYHTIGIDTEQLRVIPDELDLKIIECCHCYFHLFVKNAHAQT